eukprot:5320050-Amphidinium_carterae.1
MRLQIYPCPGGPGRHGSAGACPDLDSKQEKACQFVKGPQCRSLVFVCLEQLLVQYPACQRQLQALTSISTNALEQSVLQVVDAQHPLFGLFCFVHVVISARLTNFWLLASPQSTAELPPATCRANSCLSSINRLADLYRQDNPRI